ncbi:hypothetical protein HH303_05280 [Rhodospirillaceae bacterium KN72]|uniref:Uncharacterized protein n=1 Tax=Pacificispira spongiicola TaxID=2729598 RepID=A0A7Y0DYC5_9PROT|nr:hypothetical protein [Pacificispira spongiicola]NMM43877.1 hypothetical protein [Pacificispira spongiicola]
MWRKEVWEWIRNSGTICSTLTGRGNTAFASETAAAIGKTKQDINRAVSRAEKIAPDVLAEVSGTDHDKGVELDALKRLSPDEQRQALQSFLKVTFRRERQSFNVIRRVSFVTGVN